MDIGFHVDGQDVGPGPGEIKQVASRLADHQMDVEDGAVLIGKRPQRFHGQRPKADIGHEVTVHHIHMQPLNAGVQRLAGLLAQTGKVSR
jgi:hypothetical protein